MGGFYPIGPQPDRVNFLAKHTKSAIRSRRTASAFRSDVLRSARILTSPELERSFEFGLSAGTEYATFKLGVRSE